MTYANLGDYEAARAYPITIAAAATEIPGYEGCNAAALAAFNNAPFGTTWIVRSSAIASTIPVGAEFRKLTQTAYGSGGRITRVINPSVDVIAVGSAVDTFVTSLTATGGSGTVQITGTTLRGNGAAIVGGKVEITVDGISTKTCSVAIATGTIISHIGGAAGTGIVANISSGAAGAFDLTFTYSGAGTVGITVRYLSLVTSTTATVS